MNDLNTLLDRAAGPAAAPVDARADLTRGRGALSRTRRRRGAAGLAGMATLGVVGVGLGRALTDGSEPASARHDVPTVASDPTSSTAPVDPPWAPPGPDLTAGPYTFPAIPQGWEVQGHHPQVVTIAPVGFADQEPLSFPGKLVINYDQNPPFGDQVERDGRTFFVDTSGDTATLAVRTRPGEPVGEVTIQYPTSAGWSVDDMIAFLDGVHVGANALPGLG